MKATSDRYSIVLEGAGGPLDARTATNAEEIRAAVIDLAIGCDFSGGDVIRIIDRQQDD